MKHCLTASKVELRKMSEIPTSSNDPFENARKEGPVLKCPFQGEELPMILRLKDEIIRQEGGVVEDEDGDEADKGLH